ncbi:MAG TPA: adenylate/guanylate cyclase domain-containing protein [Pyrinomonadaceae bacterium]
MTPRTHRQHSISQVFEQEFALEILKSDRQRITMLMCVLAVAALVIPVISVFSFENFQSSFKGRFSSFVLTFVVIFTVTLSCLALERLAITRLIKQQKRARPFLQYVSALIETSIPSIALIVTAQFLGPVYSLFTPAPFVYALMIVLSTLRLDFRLCVFTGAVAAIEYWLLSWIFIATASNSAVEPILLAKPPHIVKGLLILLTGIAAGLVTSQIRKRILNSFQMVEERNRISRTFGEYVSPVVMEKLLTLRPDLRSEKRTVCVMFLDIRNFTTYAEKTAPEEVVAYLESLFEFMIEIVNRHHGIVNKFLGDGFMAVFGAPISDGSDCFNGVAAAREILSRVDEEVKRGNVAPTTVGIGLHAGEAVTGSIGSSLRREYTVIGDVVNLASRIEQLNKVFGSHLLVSDNVWQTLGDDFNDAIPMGQVKVKGREESIQLYQMA